MTISNPSNNNQSTKPGVVGMTSQARMRLNNLMMRALNVADPDDPNAVAAALLERYRAMPRARAIETEAQGLPILVDRGGAREQANLPIASDNEYEHALNDVNRDLQELTTNSILKDISPELQGWASAIRGIIQEGINASRFALDVTKRDLAFAMRRSLGDYARMARLIGALTPAVHVQYRQLAQSLDEAAAVILVKMGESLANVSFKGGRFLLQVTYTELQSRRDAVVMNLRNLLHSHQIDYGQEAWPRGLDAYRKLYRELERQGQGDLRALLSEHELARSMDTLIQRAAQGDIAGLRAVGATAQLDLQRFRRLLSLSQNLVFPESPPLTAFLQALQLFVDAFADSGGFRLLRIARPSILFYGIYGDEDASDNAGQRLNTLVIHRGRLASQLDCLCHCCADDDAVLRQVILDKVLYDVDRAIDLYAMGTRERGEPEIRAAAFSFLFDEARSAIPQQGNQEQFPAALNDALKTINSISDQLRSVLDDSDESSDSPCAMHPSLSSELCSQLANEQHWSNLIKSMAPSCTSVDKVHLSLNTLIKKAVTTMGCKPCIDYDISMPPTLENSLAGNQY